MIDDQEVDPVNQQLVRLIEAAADLANAVTLDLQESGQQVSPGTQQILREFQELFNELNNELDGSIGIQ